MTDKIDCFAKKENSVYLSADKKLFYCCWSAFDYQETQILNTDSSFTERFFKEKKFDNDFNDVTKFSVNTIVEKGIFKEYENSWSDVPFRECNNTCRVKSGTHHKQRKLTDEN